MPHKVAAGLPTLDQNVGTTVKGLPVPQRPNQLHRRSLTRHLQFLSVSAAQWARAYCTKWEVPGGTHTPSGHSETFGLCQAPFLVMYGPERYIVRCHAPQALQRQPGMSQRLRGKPR